MHKTSGQRTNIHHWVVERNVKSKDGKFNGRMTKATDVYADTFEEAVHTFRMTYPNGPFDDEVLIISVNKVGKDREVLVSPQLQQTA